MIFIARFYVPINSYIEEQIYSFEGRGGVHGFFHIASLLGGDFNVIAAQESFTNCSIKSLPRAAQTAEKRCNSRKLINDAVVG